MEAEGAIFFVMGVSGCGKTTLGRALAGHLGLPFFDGDAYHPVENIRKMEAGIPLADEDREGWLARLNQLALDHQDRGAVIACSALKERYRKRLGSGLGTKAIWIYLQGGFGEIQARLEKRQGHYMPASLLQSQFEALEPPPYGIHVPVSLSVKDAVCRVVDALDKG
jgi:carbohydrate kinase (thermoresistant glucokinase family)